MWTKCGLISGEIGVELSFSIADHFRLEMQVDITDHLFVGMTNKKNGHLHRDTG